MKHFKQIMLALAGVLVVSVLIAAVSNPQKIGLFYSSDGTGNNGTWLAVTGSGTPYTGSVQPAGTFVSTDGSGNPGTWAAATAATFGNTGGAPGWLQFLGDGSDGAYSCPSGSCTMNSGEYWYSSFNVASGATVRITTTGNTIANNLGLTVLRVNGLCTVAGTISAQANNGASSLTGVTTLFGGSGGGGGGGSSGGANGFASIYTIAPSSPILPGGTFGAGGGGGAAGGNGSNAVLPYAKQFAAGMEFPLFAQASGPLYFGGAQGGAGGNGGPAGGGGGGSFVLVCGSINFTGGMDARASQGSPSTGNNIGASGGGGDGFVIVRSPKWIANTGTISVTGNTNGGTCGAFTGCGAGGKGGDGWSLVFTN